MKHIYLCHICCLFYGRTESPSLASTISLARHLSLSVVLLVPQTDGRNPSFRHKIRHLPLSVVLLVPYNQDTGENRKRVETAGSWRLPDSLDGRSYHSERTHVADPKLDVRVANINIQHHPHDRYHYISTQ